MDTLVTLVGLVNFVARVGTEISGNKHLSTLTEKRFTDLQKLGAVHEGSRGHRQLK